MQASWSTQFLLLNLVFGNRPILMAPKFGLDDGSTSDFDVTLVLASMLVSQLHPQNPPECPPAADPETCDRADQGTGSAAQQEGSRACVSEQPSDHTRIWSELSGRAFISVFFSFSFIGVLFVKRKTTVLIVIGCVEY